MAAGIVVGHRQERVAVGAGYLDGYLAATDGSCNVIRLEDIVDWLADYVVAAVAMRPAGETDAVVAAAVVAGSQEELKTQAEVVVDGTVVAEAVVVELRTGDVEVEVAVVEMQVEVNAVNRLWRAD